MNKKPLTKQEINSLIKKQKKISLNNEWLDIKNCEGRILAKNIVSKINVPPFNNSAVDGYFGSLILHHLHASRLLSSQKYYNNN